MRSLVPILLLLASTALAADNPLDFGKGPAKWLMTKEEERAWRGVKSADAAKNFIEVFWVRRDPTPGTIQNEYRDEFGGRVAYADKSFKERNIRGAMTDRGRAIIVLGYPSNMGDETAKYAKQEATDSTDFTGGRRLGARGVWLWNHADALVKFDMPKVEIVFITDPVKDYTYRDPQRGDFVAANAVAIKRSIVSPDLKEVPAWARPQIVTVPSNIVLRVEKEGETTQTVTTTTTIVPAPQLVALPKGAGKLTLVRDAFAIEAQTKKDPFAGVTSLEQFKSGEELGFIAEFCAGMISEELKGVTVQAKITGMVNGEKINMNGPAEELVPDSIKVSPGCHLVRGAIPLEGVDPGNYTLALSVSAGADQYNLTRAFRIE